MDFSESTKVVFQRIQKLDPENVSKIIGHFLLEAHGEHEMLRLAFGPDYMIQSLVNKAKRDLGISPKPVTVSGHVSDPQPRQSLVSNLTTNFTPFTPSSSRATLPSTASFANNGGGQWDPPVTSNLHIFRNQEYLPTAYLDSGTVEYGLQNHPQLLPPEYLQVNNYCPELVRNLMLDQMFPVRSGFFKGIPEISMKICQDFANGYCDNGATCRSLHVLHLANGRDMVLNPEYAGNDPRFLQSRSLTELEMEIVEILKARRGIPILVSSLPFLYYEKYGRVLQVEEYLTENQRQGHPGCGLIQLLAPMTSSIRIIDRPQGHPSVILVDDIPRLMKSLKERIEQEENIAVSCKVYLTFPAECTLREKDIYFYFSKFGPVNDVRIPVQEKRMFGFVTFAYLETVREVLSKGNPHFIRGAQVLVKPYRNKQMLDRNFEEKVQPHMPSTSRSSEADSKHISKAPGSSEDRRLLKKPVLEHEEPVELERNPLQKIGDTNSSSQNSFFSYTYYEAFGFPEGVWSNGYSSKEKVCHTETENNNIGEEVNLLDSPFACEVGSGVSSAHII